MCVCLLNCTRNTSNKYNKSKHESGVQQKAPVPKREELEKSNRNDKSIRVNSPKGAPLYIINRLDKITKTNRIIMIICTIEFPEGYPSRLEQMSIQSGATSRIPQIVPVSLRQVE